MPTGRKCWLTAGLPPWYTQPLLPVYSQRIISDLQDYGIVYNGFQGLPVDGSLRGQAGFIEHASKKINCHKGGHVRKAIGCVVVEKEKISLGMLVPTSLTAVVFSWKKWKISYSY